MTHESHRRIIVNTCSMTWSILSNTDDTESLTVCRDSFLPVFHWISFEQVWHSLPYQLPEWDLKLLKNDWCLAICMVLHCFDHLKNAPRFHASLSEMVVFFILCYLCFLKPKCSLAVSVGLQMIIKSCEGQLKTMKGLFFSISFF